MVQSLKIPNHLDFFAVLLILKTPRGKRIDVYTKIGGIFLLVLVSSIILLIYRHRKAIQAEREYKQIQIQMDTLEETSALIN